MFKQKIFEMLKTKYAHIGFSKEVLEGVATNLSAFVSEETQIEPAVNGAELMLKSFQSYADNRVNSFRSESEKYKKEVEELKAKLNQEDKSSTQEQEPPQWAKALIQSQQETQNALAMFQKEKQNQSLNNQFVEQMKAKGVPEFYYTPIIRGREFADENAVENLVTSVVADFEKFQTQGAKEGFTYVKPPENGANPQKDENAIAQIIKQGTKEIVQSKN